MVGLGPHQENPRQAGSQRTEPIGSQRQGNFSRPNHEQNQENERNREGSVNTTQTSKSHSQVGSRVSQRQNSNQTKQQEINDLKKKLRHAQKRQSPSNSDISSNDEEDGNYRQRSRTPLSETFSYEDEHHHRRKHKGPSSRGLGNDVMSKALDQISKSPFTRKIEGARLPRRFHQLTFTLYNGQTDPVEHVSQFNQRMAVHSKNEALMCEVFPSSLGPVAMRWFNDLKMNSIDSYKRLIQAFGSRFITNTRVPWPLSSLLSLSMREGETLKAYSDRY